MKVKTSANSFGTFLETVESRRAAKANRGASGGSMEILKQLENDGETVPELIERSGMEFQEFMDAFEMIREAGLIVLSKDNNKEIVKLTDSGTQVLRLAHE